MASSTMMGNSFTTTWVAATNSTRYVALAGISSYSDTEANFSVQRLAGVLSGLWVKCTTNTNINKIDTVNVMVGGSPGNNTIAIPSGTTGTYQDTTHSDTITDTTLIDIRNVTAA
jgi:hypothetical protein